MRTKPHICRVHGCWIHRTAHSAPTDHNVKAFWHANRLNLLERGILRK